MAKARVAGQSGNDDGTAGAEKGSKARKPAKAKTSIAGKRGPGSLFGAVLAVALVVAAFLFGARSFTAKRSTLATVCAARLSEDSLCVYRLPSGILDEYAPVGDTSPFINIPLASRLTILNPDKKAIKREDFAPGPGSEKIVTITMNPAGQVCRILEVPHFFRAEGNAVVKGKREFQLAKTSYFAGGTLFLSSGELTGRSGDDIEGYIETGDEVMVLGVGDQAVVLDVVKKAGKVSVSANVTGARVYVDGALRGKAPCVVTAAPGDREVVVKAEGYVDRKVRVQVASLAETQLAVNLVEATGTLSLSTKPPGASVFVSGELKGKTPLNVALRPGSYEVRLDLPGYYSRSSQAKVVKDTEQAIALPLLKMAGDAGGAGSPGGGTTPGGGASSPEERLVATGRVLDRSGDVLEIGDRWTECVLSGDVVVQDSSGDVSSWRIRPGDTVTVYGPSASDIRLVKIDAAIGDTVTYEANLVITPSGCRVFGDDGMLKPGVPLSLEVVDPADHVKDPLQNVPSGSRVKLSVNSSGDALWAEYVWKAGASEDGVIAALSGSLVTVAPKWEDLSISTATTVFVGDKKTAFWDIKVGDSVVVAGPVARDIRFIWVRNRVWTGKEINAVAVSAVSKEGKTLYEVGGRSVRGYPVYAGSSVALLYPAEKRTVLANELQYGDRVRIQLNENRQISWGEVTVKDDTRFSRLFLGEKDGFYYFDSFVKLAPAQDLVIVGLTSGEDLQPGTRVLVGAKGSSVNYIEVQTEVNPDEWVSGTILSSKDLLWIRGDGFSASFVYAKDTWFVDWALRRDGLVSGLFPGDKVLVATGIGRPRDAVWVERTYMPPFKIEGIIEAIDGRTLVISDKVTRRTITVVASARIIKDKEETGIYALAVGDKVKASGKDKASVDILVVGL